MRGYFMKDDKLSDKPEQIIKGKRIKLKFVGSRIRAWRKAAPMKSFELAELLIISQGSLSDIENNKSLPSADTIASFHVRTDIDVLWMLTGVKGDKSVRVVPKETEEILTINLRGGLKRVLITNE